MKWSFQWITNFDFNIFQSEFITWTPQKICEEDSKGIGAWLSFCLGGNFFFRCQSIPVNYSHNSGRHVKGNFTASSWEKMPPWNLVIYFHPEKGMPRTYLSFSCSLFFFIKNYFSKTNYDRNMNYKTHTALENYVL